MKPNNLLKKISALILIAAVATMITACSNKNKKTAQKEEVTENQIKTSKQPFRQWLFEYIPSAYPNAKMTDHKYWLQAHIGEDLTVNWALFDQKDVNLKYIEDHNLTQGKSIFIEKAEKLDWDKQPNVVYFEDAGYLVSGYDSATMGNWNVQDCNVIQFDGDPKKFTEAMAKAWKKTKRNN